jgi:hypothetical protein
MLGEKGVMTCRNGVWQRWIRYSGTGTLESACGSAPYSKGPIRAVADCIKLGLRAWRLGVARTKGWWRRGGFGQVELLHKKSASKRKFYR